jgi:hypothetical protein
MACQGALQGAPRNKSMTRQEACENGPIPVTAPEPGRRESDERNTAETFSPHPAVCAQHM